VHPSHGKLLSTTLGAVAEASEELCIGVFNVEEELKEE
jgi:hypothetical protein